MIRKGIRIVHGVHIARLDDGSDAEIAVGDSFRTRSGEGHIAGSVDRAKGKHKAAHFNGGQGFSRGDSQKPLMDHRVGKVARVGAHTRQTVFMHGEVRGLYTHSGNQFGHVNAEGRPRSVAVAINNAVPDSQGAFMFYARRAGIGVRAVAVQFQGAVSIAAGVG